MENQGGNWKLLILLYGISEPEIRWATIIKGWILEEIWFYLVPRVSQTFVKRYLNGALLFILEKIANDLLFSEKLGQMNSLSEINKRYRVRKNNHGRTDQFKQLQSNTRLAGTIMMRIKEKMDSIDQINNIMDSRKQSETNENNSEYDSYRSTEGSVIWAGNRNIPDAAYIEFYIQKVAPKLSVSHLSVEKSMIKLLRD